METLLGIRGKDFVIVAADRYASMSIIRAKDDDDNKLLDIALTPSTGVLAVSGEAGDRDAMGNYFQKNIKLAQMRSGHGMTIHAASNFIRTEFAHALRKAPALANVLVAGVDAEGEGSLYWIDYLGTMSPVDKAAHGYGGYFALAHMDACYRPDLTKEQALAIILQAATECRKRLVVSQSHFCVKVLTKDAIETKYISNGAISDVPTATPVAVSVTA